MLNSLRDGDDVTVHSFERMVLFGSKHFSRLAF